MQSFWIEFMWPDFLDSKHGCVWFWWWQISAKNASKLWTGITTKHGFEDRWSVLGVTSPGRINRVNRESIGTVRLVAFSLVLYQGKGFFEKKVWKAIKACFNYRPLGQRVTTMQQHGLLSWMTAGRREVWVTQLRATWMKQVSCCEIPSLEFHPAISIRPSVQLSHLFSHLLIRAFIPPTLPFIPPILPFILHILHSTLHL